MHKISKNKMIMNRNFLLTLVLAFCSTLVSAQTYYYYYQGNKRPLTLNEGKVCVSIPKDCEKTSETIRANVQTLNTIGDEAFDIYVITRSDFEKLTSLEFW